MIEIKAPHLVPYSNLPKIFLAGTIDMGKSRDWQSLIKSGLADFDCILINPRRDNWDSSWKQEYENSEFFKQVVWELSNLEKADWIIMNFEKTSQSPISLLELGIHARSKKILVSCPKEFYRSGNVQVTCDYYNIPLFDDLVYVLEYLKTKL